MKAAIIGAGFIGAELVSQLAARGHEVIVLGRHAPSGQAEFIQTDICDNAALQLPPHVDAVYYLSQSDRYNSFPDGAADLFGVNTLGAVRAAEAAQKNGCRFFFYASTGNVYAPSFTPLKEDSPLNRTNAYALSKIAAEEALRLFKPHFSLCAGRIFGAYGPNQCKMLPYVLAKRIRDGQPITLAPGQSGSDGGLQVSFIYNPDLALRMALLAEHALQGNTVPEILNLGGPRGISIKAFAENIGFALGVSPQFTSATDKRSGDLIADISLLQKTIPLPFTSDEESFAATYTL